MLVYEDSLQPTMQLWVFAIHYGFQELENLCLAAEQVKREILFKLRAPQAGVGYFLNDTRLPLSLINKLICAILSPGAWAEIIRREHEDEARIFWKIPIRI